MEPYFAKHSKTSMAQTRITWMIPNHFRVSRNFFPIAQENEYLGIFSGNFLILSYKMYVVCKAG